MADWNSPGLTTAYATVLSELKAREVDAYSLAESPTNPPTGAIRYRRAQNKFQEWDGAAWQDKTIAVAGGGTGAITAADARTNLGLGTIAIQDANNITITGGSISGLSSLAVSGNATISGTITSSSTAVNSISTPGGIRAGSPTVDIIGTDGKIPAISSTYFANLSGANLTGIPESAITDGSILARLAGNETISGSWNFSALLSLAVGAQINNADPQIIWFESDAASDAKYWRWISAAGTFVLQAVNDAFSVGNNAIEFYRSGNTPTIISCNANLTVTNTEPIFKLTESDGPSDEKRYRFISVAGDLKLQLQNDAESSTFDALTFIRNGMNITSLTVRADFFNVANASADARLVPGVSPIGSHVDLSSFDVGANSIGAEVRVGRNTNGSGAPGCLRMLDRSGTTWYIWVDTTGDLRIGTTAPIQSIGDTGGTVVGTQS